MGNNRIKAEMFKSIACAVCQGQQRSIYQELNEIYEAKNPKENNEFWQHNFNLHAEISSIHKAWDEFVAIHPNAVVSSAFNNFLVEFENFATRVTSEDNPEKKYMLSYACLGLCNIANRVKITQQLNNEFWEMAENMVASLRDLKSIESTIERMSCNQLNYVNRYFVMVDFLSFFLRSFDDELLSDKYFYTIDPGHELAVVTKRQRIFDCSQERMLTIRFPDFMLEKPDELIPSLIHEVSHYSGDKLRLREDRAACMQYISAYYIYLLLLYHGSASSRQAFGAIYQQIKKIYNTNYQKSNMQAEYLFQMSDLLYQAVLTLVSTDYDSWWNDFFSVYESKKWKRKKVRRKKEFQYISMELPNVLNYMDDVFSEVYADIIMIYILDMNLCSYIEWLKKYIIYPIDNHAIRLNMIRICVFDESADNAIVKCSDECRDFCDRCIKICEEQLPYNVIRRMAKHFKKVYSNIVNKQEFKEVREKWSNEWRSIPRYV